MSAVPDLTDTSIGGEPRIMPDVLLGVTAALVIIDETGSVVDANPALGALCDRDVSELCAMDFQKLVWGQDFDHYRTWLGGLPSNSAGDSLDLRLLPANGTRKWARLHASPLTERQGRRRFIVYVEDIAEQTATEESLRYRTSLNELLTGLSCDYEQVVAGEFDTWVTEALGRIAEFVGADRSYIFSISPDGKTLSNSHEWCREGIEPQIDFLQDLPIDAFPWWLPFLSAGQVLNMARLSDMPEEAAFERQLLEGQGIKSLLSLPLIAGGELVGFTGFDAVRQERVWPEEAILLLRSANSLFTSALVHLLTDSLRDSEERYRTVVEDVRSVIFRIDRDGRWSFLNRAWEELSDQSIEDAIGRQAIDFIHPADRDRTAEAMRGMVSAGEDVRRIEVRVVVRGEIRWVGVHGRALWGSDGSLDGYAGSIDDITDRKVAEEEAERAREETERASRAKSEFLSRMSHELRTPLNAIIGFSQLLEMSDLDAEEAENVSHIARAGEHLLELINEVLDIVRIESGQMALSLEPVELVEVIDESLNLVRPAADKRRLRVLTSLGVLHALWAQADRRRLKQVLVNLLGNAVKYNCDGGTITVTCSRQGQGMVRIEVADTGIGIAPDRMDEVFVPFERLGAERSSIEGTGMGLTVTKRLVEAMGGTITVTSTQGLGSCFTVDLPAAGSRTDRSLSELPPTDDRTPEPGEHDAVVLYVEDNPSNATLVRRVLAFRPNIELIVARDGMTGVELARTTRPDLILLDLHLPDIDGAEVLGLLSTEVVTRDIPVVIVSADASAGQAKRLVQLGANDYVTKPIDVTRFLATIDHYLKTQAKG